MTDFSSHAVKVAAHRVSARIMAGTFEGHQLSNGDHETTEFGCIVRVTFIPGSGPVLRVIDANGRHWFPEVTA